MENIKLIDIEIDDVNVKYPCLCSSIPHEVVISPTVMKKMKRILKKLKKHE